MKAILSRSPYSSTSRNSHLWGLLSQMPTFPKIITLTIAYEVFEGGFTPYYKDAARMPSLAIKSKLIKGKGPGRIHEYHASLQLTPIFQR